MLAFHKVEFVTTELLHHIACARVGGLEQNKYNCKCWYKWYHSIDSIRNIKQLIRDHTFIKFVAYVAVCSYYYFSLDPRPGSVVRLTIIKVKTRPGIEAKYQVCITVHGWWENGGK